MTHHAVPAERLTIYCSESDRHDGHNLMEWLLRQAYDQGLGGATTHKALAGFGHHRRMHHQHVLVMAEELPIVIEIIDIPEQIDTFLDAVSDAIESHTYIRESVRWHQPKKNVQ
ncbi:DUF190 domain-containing protein [Planctomycetales bacterium ZRK34]|nr:DUF190 domain-containing protein [Planctomycetales bacterium ZRK34]